MVEVIILLLYENYSNETKKAIRISIGSRNDKTHAKWVSGKDNATEIRHRSSMTE